MVVLVKYLASGTGWLEIEHELTTIDRATHNIFAHRQEAIVDHESTRELASVMVSLAGRVKEWGYLMSMSLAGTPSS